MQILNMIYLLSAILISLGSIPLLVNIQGIYIVFFIICYIVLALIGLQFVRNAYNKQIQTVTNCLKQINAEYDNDLNSKISALSCTFTNELEELAEELNAASQIKSDMYMKSNEYQGKLKQISQERAIDSENIRKCSDDYNFLDNNVTKISSKTLTITGNLTDEIRTLAQLVASVDNGVKIQLFKLRETKENMANITKSSDGIAENTNVAAEGATSSREAALIGVKEVMAIISNIEKVKDTVVSLIGTMQNLSEKANNISAVMDVINEVADQTNLLALNAAIEAARAGEAGKGFSVVAGEVRKLAEKTMQATREVEVAVQMIQKETAINIEAVNEAASYALEGVKYASSAGEFMNNIVERLMETADQLNNIANATANQLESSKESDKALAEIENVAETTASHVLTFTSAILNISNNMEQVDIMTRVIRSADIEAELDNVLIKWTSEFELGIPIIDAQHQILCLYINALHRFMREKRDSSELHKLVTCLKDYTITHFNSEEQYFSRSDYPDTKAHKKLHADFVNKIIDVENKMENKSIDVSAELLEFLKKWLINHIQGTDKKYVSYVKTSTAKLGI